LRPRSSLCTPRRLSCVPTTTPPAALYPLSLHDALPICASWARRFSSRAERSTCCWVTSSVASDWYSSVPRPSTESRKSSYDSVRSEEHTSELQSRFDIVCRLLLEKKKLASSSQLYRRIR